MQILELIGKLQSVAARHGDIEVTCTGTAHPDDPLGTPLPDVFETTVETLKVHAWFAGKAVRLML